MRFEDLDVWKRSARLSATIYKELVGLKDYGFKDQITRSGLSIPSNVAEGCERPLEDRDAGRGTRDANTFNLFFSLISYVGLLGLD